MRKLKTLGVEYPLPIPEELKERIKNSNAEDCYKLYVHVVHDLNDMYYVGVTKIPISHRWRNGGGYMFSGRFYKKIKEHGWSNIDHIVLNDSLSEETAHALEIEVIKALNSTDPARGFNISTGGSCGANGVKKFGKENHYFGKKHSKKTRELIKKNHAPCAGKDNSFFGKKHSAESRIKMSESHKGKYLGAENSVSKKVINIESGLVFDTVKDACAFAGSRHVGDVCRGTRNTAGTKNGTKLHWRFL